jgi:hypothetical protein
MASYELNHAAVTFASQLIEARRYVLRSDWGRYSRTRMPAN